MLFDRSDRAKTPPVRVTDLDRLSTVVVAERGNAAASSSITTNQDNVPSGKFELDMENKLFRLSMHTKFDFTAKQNVLPSFSLDPFRDGSR